MAYLRFLDDTGRLCAKTLEAEHFVIGRADTCQLSLESDMISREHVRIDVDNGGRFRIRDLDSRNRTYVNGELITEALLTPGAIIRIGDRVVEFVDEGVASEKFDLGLLLGDKSEPDHCEWIKAKAPLSLTHAQIEQLAQLIGEQPLTSRAEDLADTALGQIVLDTQADRGFIVLRGETMNELLPLAHRAFHASEGGKVVPASKMFVVAPLRNLSAGRYPATAGQIDSKSGVAATAMVAPLAYRGKSLGLLYVDRPASKKPFPAPALQYLAAAGTQLGTHIGGAAEKQTQLAGREGAAWLSTIRRLQSSLNAPVLSGDVFEAKSKLYPGRLQCGDFATVIHPDAQRCGLLVIDGGGGGIMGIAQAAAIRTSIEAAGAAVEDLIVDPAPVFNAINTLIAKSQARQILPCTFVGMDATSGKITYINAGGMPPLLMVAPGRLLTLDQTSLVLGVDADYVYQTTRVELPDVFRIVCCTDGVTEATSAGGQPFGDQRLHETLLDRDVFGTASQVLAAIDKAWSIHLATAQTADDALVLVVGRG